MDTDLNADCKVARYPSKYLAYVHRRSKPQLEAKAIQFICRNGEGFSLLFFVDYYIEKRLNSIYMCIILILFANGRRHPSNIRLGINMLIIVKISCCVEFRTSNDLLLQLLMSVSSSKLFLNDCRF